MADNPPKPKAAKTPKKRKEPMHLRSKKKRAGKKKKKKVVIFRFRDFKVTQPIDMKNYVMEYSISNDDMMEFRKGKIKYANNPKFEVHDTKASTLKDEFSGLCGRKQGIKNWLFYV